jgi:hypothetical protein
VDVKRRIFLLAVGAAIIAAIVFTKSRRDSRAEGAAPAPATAQHAAPAANAAMPSPAPPTRTSERTFAELILAEYADPARTPEEDLRAMARTLGNFALLVKGDNPLPLGSNEEIAAALRGKNRAQLRALSEAHSVFDPQGRLIDRWGTPLYFHAQSRDRLEIRSAGPDREMWTDDDLHRKHDGTFLRGEALLAPSLFDEKAARQ